MSTLLGFDRDLEGFQIKGNLTVAPFIGDIEYGGDGSIEAAGTLYVNQISNYNSDNPIQINDTVLFEQNFIHIKHTIESTSSSIGSLLLSGGLSISNSVDSVSYTSGGALTIAGGVAIGKKLYVNDNTFINGELSMELNKISKLEMDLLPDGKDAVNVDYLQDYVIDYVYNNAGKLNGEFDPNQVLIGDTSGYLQGYPSFTFNNQTQQLALNGNSANIYISNSTPAIDLSNGSSFTTLGGASFLQNVFIGTGLDVNEKRITNVADPINDLDAVNKEYLEDFVGEYILNNAGLINGTFESFQLIFGSNSTSGAIEGSDNFTFNGEIVKLVSSNQTALLIEGGGGLVVSGGSIYVSEGIDLAGSKATNLGVPTNPADAVNLEYLNDSTIDGVFQPFQLTFGSADSDRIVNGSDILTFDPDAGILNISGGSLYVSEGIDLVNSKISNLAPPTDPTDAVNLSFLESVISEGTIDGSFGAFQLTFGSPDMPNFIESSSNLTFDLEKLTITTENGGTAILVLDSNITISRGSLYVSEGIDLAGSKAINLDTPTNPADAVNLEYLNDNTIDGMFQPFQLTFGSVDSDRIVNGSGSLTFDPESKVLSVSGGSMYVSEGINLANSKISNLAPPTEPTDAVNLSFLESVISENTIDGSFGAFQLTFGSPDTPNLIESSSNLTFDREKLTITTENGGTSVLVLDSNITISGGSLYVSQGIDLANSKIINLDAPTNPADAVNLEYLNDSTIDGVFQPFQLTFGSADSNRIVNGSSSLTFDPESKLLSVSGGSIYVSEGIDLANSKISNLAPPTEPADAVNLSFLESFLPDSAVTGSFGAYQLVFGSPDPNSNLFIEGSPQLTFDGTSLNLYDTRLNITNSQENSITTLGGIQVSKTAFIDEGIVLNDSKITGLDTTLITEPSDAVNVDYLEIYVADYIANNTSKIDGVFDPYQIIVGSQSTIGALEGFPNFTFDGSNLYIGSSIGNVLIEKFVNLENGLDLNTKRITSVAMPVDGLDAVNKNYVDTLINSIDCCGGGGGGGTGGIPSGFEQSVILDSSKFAPVDIPGFYFDNDDVKAFLTYIYVNLDNTKYAFYTLRGLLDKDTWILNQSFIGEPLGIDFYIRSDTEAGRGIIQYTNTNFTQQGLARYRTPQEINDVATDQAEYTLLNNVLTPTSSDILFLNQDTLASVLTMYVTAPDDKTALYEILTLQKDDGVWIYHMNHIGDQTGVNFVVENGNGFSVVKYTNNNTSGITTVRVKRINIRTSLRNLILDNDISEATPIEELTFGQTGETSFDLKVYLEVHDQDNALPNKYAYFYILGYLHKDTWLTNVRFIGDLTGVQFNMVTDSNIGKLTYTNSNTSGTTLIKYIKTEPLEYTPLSVSQGGTGNNTLLLHSVLRGNGTDPIVGTSDFIYKDYILTLGEQSSILLYNTTEATHASDGGTFTTLGGASIGKNLYVNGVEFTPNSTDIFTEKCFMANNGVFSEEDITHFRFSDTVRSFEAMVSIEINSLNGPLFAVYKLLGLQKSDLWIVNYNYIGDNTAFKFYITPTGQVRYTNNYIEAWQNTKVHFRALTTSVNCEI
jgi:hypothetical protein